MLLLKVFPGCHSFDCGGLFYIRVLYVIIQKQLPGFQVHLMQHSFTFICWDLVSVTSGHFMTTRKVLAHPHFTGRLQGY